VYNDMDQWIQIRQRVLREGVSKRQIMRETGMHWETLKKILEHSIPPGYRRSKSPKKPKIEPYLDRIRQILEQDDLPLLVGPVSTRGFHSFVLHRVLAYAA